MGKFLRVLTIFIFLFAIAALTLGIMLFNRREILKGRTQKLETAVRQFAKTLEAEEPPIPEPVPQYPARDESEVTAAPVTDPLRSDFWNRYNHALEEGSSTFLELDSRSKLRQLMSYYRWDVVEDKAWRDPLTGQKSTDGEGTLQELLNGVQRQAEAQLARLLRTRAELVKTRRELVTTVTELNQHKGTLRDRLAEIVRLNGEITRLNGEIRRKDMQIEELQGTVRNLEGRIQDFEQQVRLLEEQLDDQRLRNEQHLETIARLRGIIDVLEKGSPRGPTPTEEGDHDRTILTRSINLTIAAGPKGRVISVNEHHGFVVMELNQEFLNELRGQLETRDQVPAVRLNVQRGEGEDAEFVSRVRLTQLREDQGLGIGDIMTNWQQMPIQPGDTVVFQ